MASTTTEYIIDQTITYQVHGLKPNTVHKLYILSYDISAACTPKGGTVGAQIVTDTQGKCEFTLSLYTLDRLQASSSTARKYRLSLWAEIRDTILREYSLATTGRAFAGYTTWADMTYETVLKNTTGDSFAKGSFKFRLFSETTTPTWVETGSGESSTGYYTTGKVWDPETGQYNTIFAPVNDSGMYNA